MTVIVYRDGVLAADRRGTLGSVRVAPTTKIGRARGGYLWGFAGEVQYREAFVKWADTRKGNPETSSDVTCILISPKGEVREWWGGGWITCEDEFMAWGAGDDIARGALAAGADARRAVEIVNSFHIECGDGIDLLTLKENNGD